MGYYSNILDKKINRHNVVHDITPAYKLTAQGEASRVRKSNTPQLLNSLCCGAVMENGRFHIMIKVQEISCTPSHQHISNTVIHALYEHTQRGIDKESFLNKIENSELF